MGQITPEHIRGIMVNPFYAITVAPELVEEHVPQMTDEAWIQVNSTLLRELGSESWLTQLLGVLEGSSVPTDERINPYNAINIDPSMTLEHPPAFPKEQWVKANSNLLAQLGAETWLKELLNVLEGDFVTAEDMGMAPQPKAFPTRSRSTQKKKRRRKK